VTRVTREGGKRGMRDGPERKWLVMVDVDKVMKSSIEF